MSGEYTSKGYQKQAGHGFKRLPFFCCSLSLQPFEHPVCTPEGICFDLLNIVPWLKKYGTNPVTGEKLDAKSLIKLHFHKAENGDFQDPVTFKTFTDSTHIVAIRTSGQVYAFETVQRLNIKQKSWRDLMTDEEFNRSDIITIQDPHNLESRNITAFHYVKNDMSTEDDEKAKAKKDVSYRINALGSTSKVLDQMAGGKKTAGDDDAEGKEVSKTGQSAPVKLTPAYVSKDKKAYNTAHYSTGAAASSLTSTAVSVQTRNDSALIDEEEYMFAHVKEKAYAQIQTNFGDINLELFCDQAPRACYNLIKLAKKGYYKDAVFHRSIKNFMIQGGDPTGTGKGGESCWGKPFVDEFRSNLSHSGRGILSMANRGKNTNTSQFFITYKSCQHLDNKHTIFGKVVGGMEVLTKMERVPTDDGDKPLDDIKMKNIVVFVDPFEDFTKKLGSKLTAEAAREKKEKEAREKRLQGSSKREEANTATGVGKYLNAGSGGSGKRGAEELGGGSGLDWGASDVGGAKKKAKGGAGFGDFSSW
ncbi:RING-type E3 ubiquitin-protein ligase ppil2 [Rhizophlyctis rosea]|uniref:RING-type E3 ubiquitin-protein ligase ppil2 n=1 Tax=Rhizophlyctis rosea TaxID=64517 RepID=A0AAD5SGP6_9FUNG|nr:RING-type E3 ubiquitin-protein ligase ppil2 [Rhizophlyctis rosea]